MRIAIEEARNSLREGNSGFGAVIVRGQEIISKAHDTDTTSGDPTQHAEINVIRSAARKPGNELAECVIFSTHEPCPMCSTAILWSGIKEVTYGYQIKEAIKQGRRRVDISLKEIFKRAGKRITVNSLRLGNRGDIGTQAIQFTTKEDKLAGIISTTGRENITLTTSINRRLVLPVNSLKPAEKNSPGSRIGKLKANEIITGVYPFM